MKYMTIFCALFFFIDPLIFFRVFIGDDSVSIFVAALVSLLVIGVAIKTSYWKCLFKTWWFYLILFFLYILFSTSIRYRIGQSSANLMQHSLVMMQILILHLILSRNVNYSMLVKAYLYAGFAHLVTILPFFGGLLDTLSANTAYPIGEYSIGVFTRRATGFFNSPGQLSLFAAGGLALGVSVLRFQKNRLGWSLVAISLILGIASFSRSFFVAMFLILTLTFFGLTLKRKLQLFSMLLFSFGILLYSETFSQYLDMVLDRLMNTTDFTNNDRLVGETGILEALKVVSQNPFFGNPALDDGALKAWNGEILVRPHVGFVALLCFYGIVFSAPLLILLIKAIEISIYNRLKILLVRGRPSELVAKNPFLLGFLIVNVICLVEPLMETTVYFFFLIGALNSHKKLISKI